MHSPIKPDNSQRTPPTPASEDEKAAMKRVLSKESPNELFERLTRENDTSRSDASLSRQTRRDSDR